MEKYLTVLILVLSSSFMSVAVYAESDEIIITATRGGGGMSSDAGGSGAVPEARYEPKSAQSRTCSILPSIMKEKIGECLDKITAWENPQTKICNAMVVTATKEIATGVEVGSGVKGTVVGTVIEVYSPREACLSNLDVDIKLQTGTCITLKNQLNTQLAKIGCTPSLTIDN